MDYGKFDDDEDRREKLKAQAKLTFKEFECPSCTANNPVDDGFTGGAEIQCNYCGTDFKASVTEEGRLKLREL